jgi:hypothetical protein
MVARRPRRLCAAARGAHEAIDWLHGGAQRLIDIAVSGDASIWQNWLGRTPF